MKATLIVYLKDLPMPVEIPCDNEEDAKYIWLEIGNGDVSTFFSAEIREGDILIRRRFKREDVRMVDLITRPSVDLDENIASWLGSGNR